MYILYFIILFEHILVYQQVQDNLLITHTNCILFMGIAQKNLTERHQ